MLPEPVRQVGLLYDRWRHHRSRPLQFRHGTGYGFDCCVVRLIMVYKCNRIEYKTRNGQPGSLFDEELNQQGEEPDEVMDTNHNAERKSQESD
ncbi:hypothetical protein TNCV_3902791 [Trichonephila clavipes]|nr:hypothetical protein TNCV_3902791 [Trichonephila clavipes]